MRFFVKLICAVTAIASAVILLCLICFAPRERDMSDMTADQKELSAILEDRKESTEPLSGNIYFNEYPLFYDRVNNMYYYSLIKGNSSSYDPAVTVCGGKGAKIVFAGKITDELIETGESLDAVLYTDDKYEKIQITCTTLPLLSIESEEEIGKEYVKMKAILFDNRPEAVERYLESDGKIHTRGNTSALFDKKAYRITLVTYSLGEKERERKSALLGMRQDGDWVLYAAYNDQERIRNVFSTNLWYNSCAENNSYDMMNGSEYRFVEVLINGEYRGLYALGFPMDAKQLNLADGEFAYQKLTWDPDLEIDYSDYEVLEKQYEIRAGDTDVSDAEKWSPLIRYYNYLKNAEDGDERLYDVVDIDNAIDTYLFFNMIQGVDNVSGEKTLNLTQVRKNGEKYQQTVFAPWDMDQSWGNRWNYNGKNWIGEYEIPPEKNVVMEINPVAKLLKSGDDRILEMVKERYDELRSGAWSDETLSKTIDSYENDIFNSGAYGRDCTVWPEATNLDDPSVKLDIFREYVSERMKVMDGFVASLGD